MTELEALRPKLRARVIDLVSLAGVDVSPWGSGRGPASTNPKYCYEWSFVEPGKVVVASIWYDNSKIIDNHITQDINFLDYSGTSGGPQKSAWVRRARSLEEALKIALIEQLSLRFIMNDRKAPLNAATTNIASEATTRELDPVHWSVQYYDPDTRHCRLIRNGGPHQTVDQFDIVDINQIILTQTSHFLRSVVVRRNVLNRAAGKCEHCGDFGFKTISGSNYLETHHIIAMSDNGPDVEQNVIALCPSHHRQAHYGANRDTLKSNFQNIVRQKIGAL